MKIGDLFWAAHVDNSGLTAEAQKSGAKAGTAAGKSFSSKLSGEIKRGVGVGAGFAAFNLVGSAIARVTQFLGDATQAYREDAASQVQLRASLLANIPAWDGNTDAIESVLSARTKLGFSDDEQRASLATLVTRTHDATKALQLQRVAMDLARLRGISLGQATDLLGKAFSGQVGALRKAGIAVDANATATEALVAVQKAASGQAQKYADSDLGRVEVAQVRAAEASERFGKALSEVLTPIQEVAGGLLEELADAFDHTADESRAQLRALEELRAQGIEPTSKQIMELARQYRTFAADGLRMSDHTLKGNVIPAFDDATGAAENLSDVLDDELPDGASASEVALQKLEDQVDDTNSAIDDLADTIVDELYGDTIRAGKEANLEGRIAELNAELLKTDQGSRKARELRGELAELRGELFLLHLEQAEREGPQAAIDFLQKERNKAGAAKEKIDELIASYRKLAGLQNSLGPIIVVSARAGGMNKVNAQGLAEGGRYRANVPRVVGERGPEFDIPDHSGTIYPEVREGLMNLAGIPSASSGGYSSVTNVNVQLPGLLRAETPSDVARTLRHLGAYGTFRDEAV